VSLEIPRLSWKVVQPFARGFAVWAFRIAGGLEGAIKFNLKKVCRSAQGGIRMIRVWFNHWFSTSYGLIQLMKQDEREQIYVIASNKQLNSVIQKVCDEWYEESQAEGEEYIRQCLDFCVAHRVDVFVPRRRMVEISKNRDRFEAIGVKLLADDYSVIRLLNDKAATYDFLRSVEGLRIPEYYLATNADQFEEAYGRLRENYGQVCVKFVQDEGGMSFRKIVENVDRFKRLRLYPGAEIVYEELKETLKEGGEFDALMVMPYFSGHEISVDCLSTASGLIAIPRNKGYARHERVEYREDVLTMTRAIMEKTNLQYPCNIQFRFKEEVPYLLEINTRMSGGLQMSCLAAGVNIPNIALNKLLGVQVPWRQDDRERIVSYIEIPQIIREC